MNYMMCSRGNDVDVKFLNKLKNFNVGLELGSYGLDGVKSEEAWQNKIVTHKKIIDVFKGRIAIHGPFVGLLHFHFDYFLIEAVKKRMDVTFNMVKTLKPKRLVLHTGYIEEILQFDLIEQWIDATSQFWCKEIKRYEDIGVEVVLENLTEKEPVIIKKIIENVNNGFLGVCIDVGHVNVYSPVPIRKWIKVFGSSLKHMHVHDNNGKHDQHLPVGRGKIKFKEVFKTLKINNPDCTLSLECITDMEMKIENIQYVIDMCEKG